MYYRAPLRPAQAVEVETEPGAGPGGGQSSPSKERHGQENGGWTRETSLTVQLQYSINALSRV